MTMVSLELSSRVPRILDFNVEESIHNRICPGAVGKVHSTLVFQRSFCNLMDQINIFSRKTTVISQL